MADFQDPVVSEAGHVAAGTLQAGLANTACVVLVDAAQHLRRTAILVEAATTMALQESLMPGEGLGWKQSLEASQQAMTNALQAFNEMVTTAIRMVDARPHGH